MEVMNPPDLVDGDVLVKIYPDVSFTDGVEKFDTITEKLNTIKNLIKELSDGYIWHNDSFQIQAKYVFGDGPVEFWGITNYGENIEDEWFLVHVLLQLTSKISDLVVRITDSDGEFLLIEAAEVLPSWVSPETCEGRVFIHKGHLHILPQSFMPNEDGEPFEICEEVLQFVRTRPNESLVHPSIEKPITDRMGCYPAKLSTLLYDAVVYVPVAVAAILKHNPHFVSAAVRAFCERTPIDVQVCRAMKYFPPEQRVLTCVTFTKCSYAMLVSSKYTPDKRTGWNLPAPIHETYKAHLLGIKLASGFEILLTQEKKKKFGDATGDLSSDPSWQKMKSKLETIGYFRGLLEHSKEFNELLNAAQDFYRQHCQGKSSRSCAGAGLSEVLDSIEIDIEKLKREEASLNVQSCDDSWMDISKEELDEMLAARFAGGGGCDLVDVPNQKPDSISKHLNSFINHVSGVDGVEFPQSGNVEPAPTRPLRGVKTRKKKSVQFSSDTKLHSVTSNDAIAPEQRVNFQPDGFMQAVQNILDFSIPDDNYWDSDGSGMSSYEDEDEIDLDQAPGLKNQNKMASYMNEMDKQLASTTLARSFVTKPSNDKETSGNFEDIEDFEPVDIDMNALKNIIMSYKTQMGEAGPAENILGPLGVNLQDIDADVD